MKGNFANSATILGCTLSSTNLSAEVDSQSKQLLSTVSSPKAPIVWKDSDWSPYEQTYSSESVVDQVSAILVL